jgi:alpha-glucosidase (family GH31 glycosyl hydrolase)
MRLFLSVWLVCFSFVVVSGGTVPSCMSTAARLDCGFGDEASCTNANCCWTPVQSARTANFSAAEFANPPSELLRGTPWCYSKQSLVGGYTLTSITPFQPSPTQNPGWSLSLELYDGAGYFGTDVQYVQVDVTFETAARLRVKIYDANNARWEIPESILPLAPVNSSIDVDDVNYSFSYTATPFGFAITRIDDGEVLFNTTAPAIQLDGVPLFNGLVFTDQYLEISTQLPNTPIVYGLGEKVTSLQLSTSGQPITFWARDAPSPPDQNIYGSHPVYFENRRTVSGSGGNDSAVTTKTHGAWLRNSNGMDVLIHDGNSALRTAALNSGDPNAPQSLDQLAGGSQEYGYMTYRVIGGVLDFFFYIGAGESSAPEAIVKEYHQSVGLPHMPPLWSLGFHQCRWGYANLQAVENMVSQYAAAEIPLDTAWTDIVSGLNRHYGQCGLRGPMLTPYSFCNCCLYRITCSLTKISPRTA